LYRFKLTDTIIDIKRKIYESNRDAWENDKIDDEWINTALYMNLRNNSPIKGTSKYS